MPLLTLTSDFGNQDYLVSAVKANLLKINPQFSIIDISHNIIPFNYPHTAYVCRSAISHFPSHCYHLVLVNLFEKKPEQLLLAFYNDQYILCADNGLLSMILPGKPEMVLGIPLEKEANKNTLYCTEAMGRAINQLVNGEPVHKIGDPDATYLEKNPFKPVLSDDWMEGQILFIDNFENVIINITREEFEAQRRNRPFKIVFKRDEMIDRISETYADVPAGEKLVLFNSAGYMELAINKGNAAGLFGLEGYNEKNQQMQSILQNRFYYQTIKVFFE